MSAIYRLTIPGQPIGKGRARSAAMRNRKTGRVTVRMYTPSKTERWEERAISLIRRAIGSPMLLGPLRVDVTAIFERPIKLRSKKFPDRREWHTPKPDRDNVEKIVYDSMKLAGVFKDDCQICAGETRKFVADKREAARVEIAIYQLTDMDLPASAFTDTEK